jgi:hypothetical protein
MEAAPGYPGSGAVTLDGCDRHAGLLKVHGHNLSADQAPRLN